MSVDMRKLIAKEASFAALVWRCTNSSTVTVCDMSQKKNVFSRRRMWVRMSVSALHINEGIQLRLPAIVTAVFVKVLMLRRAC